MTRNRILQINVTTTTHHDTRVNALHDCTSVALTAQSAPGRWDGIFDPGTNINDVVILNSWSVKSIGSDLPMVTRYEPPVSHILPRMIDLRK